MNASNTKLNEHPELGLTITNENGKIGRTPTSLLNGDFLVLFY